MKKRILLSLVTLSLLLTGCDDIVSKPVDIDDKTLIVDELSQIVNNTLAKVYDDYHDSSSFKQYVVDELLLKIAEFEFGAYEDLASDSDFKASVDERAKHQFYNQISGGGYTEFSKFKEKDYVIEKVYNAENSYIVDALGEPVAIGALDTLSFYDDGLFLPTINKDNFDNPSFGLVHFDYYADYIVDTFVDDIYRDKLVEKFVQSEQTSTLGRNYAREVEYVAIPVNSEHPTAASALVNAFVDNNILGAGDSDLNILANAWRGVSEDFIANEADLLELAGLKDSSGKDFTLFGDVLADFAKIDKNPNLTDKDIENTFTGNGTYTKEFGLEIEKTKIRLQNFVTSTWGIKNGGIGSLPESVRSRLFNIGVANGVDFVADDLGVLANAGKWKDGSNRLANTFVRNIDGSYYLVPKSYEKGNNRNFVFFENSTFYVVKIKEAVNTAKLSDDNNSYNDFKTPEEIADIVDEVTYHLAQLTATQTNALNYYLDKLTVVFHDETIRDYFYEQYPEVFDKDDY